MTTAFQLTMPNAITGCPPCSVIIPVCNGERFLAEAIRSVLDQTLPPDEMIVVDDGSTDRSAQIVADLAATAAVPIRYIYQANRGPAAARNAGIRLATGEFLAFLDADDLWTPEKQQRQMALMVAEAGADIVSGLTQQLLEPDDASSGDARLTIHQPYSDPHFQSKFFRARLFARVAPLDESLRFGEDIDWLVRAVQGGARIHQHKDVVVYYRRHAHNLTNQLEAINPYWLMALRKAVRRHREGVALHG
jgi:glycosyltransferase involved in cell wall biosynthesis